GESTNGMNSFTFVPFVDQPATKPRRSVAAPCLHRLASDAQCLADLLDDRLWLLLDVCRWYVARLLQRLELAVEQRRLEEVLPSGLQPRADQLVAALQVHEPHVVPGFAQPAAVGALQRRAGDHRG